MAFRCKALDEMADFYQGKLGLERAGERVDEDGEICEVRFKIARGQEIVLYPPTIRCPQDRYTGDNRQCERSHYHCCFQTKDRHRVIGELEQKGVFVNKRADGSTGLCGSYCQFVADPEGNVWEIMEFTPKSLQIVCD